MTNGDDPNLRWLILSNTVIDLQTSWTNYSKHP